MSNSVQQLTEKEQVTKEIRVKIENIREIWEQSSGKFADISDDVNQLLLAKRHVERVISMLQNFLNIEERVDELKLKLADNEELFQVYKKIKVMNYMRMSFLQRIEQQAESLSQGDKSQAVNKLKKIKEHFKTVRDLEKQFYEIIYLVFEDAYAMSKKDP